MKNMYLAILLCSCCLFADAQQQAYKYTYQQLREYEGVYHYINSSTLQMAASPKDTVLYAIVSQARYALHPVGKDSFLNNAHQPIRFLRSASNKIIAYTYRGDTLALINRSVTVSDKMWYPRLGANTAAYQYHQPDASNDGLATGSIASSGLDSALLNTMVRKIIAGDYPNVHSVLIIKDGKLIFEEYFYEYTADTLQSQRSASKSVVSALTGIAIHQGLIKSVNDRMLSYFPGYHPANDSPLKEGITIDNLLSNQSGVSYDEAYNKAAGDETTMGYTDNWIKYTFDLPMLDTPGKVGRYNSGNPITMGRIIEIASGQPIAEFAVKNLFGPLGITNFKWRFKPDKTESEDFCQVFLRPRDMAKFGLLYLNNGMWNDKQVIPADWVATSTQKHSVVQGVDYGYLWWLKYFDVNGKRFYTAGAQGNGGQKIYIFKQQNMVVVITGGNFNSQSPSDRLIKTYILPPLAK